MGQLDIYQCNKCGFEFEEDYLIFYYDDIKQTTEEYELLMSTCGLDDGAEIKGSIIKTYCPDCDKVIKTYLIKELPEDMMEELAIDRVKKGIKKGKKYSLVVVNPKLHRYGENNEINQYINCPKCNKEIPITINNTSKCPKCGGQMEGGMAILSD